MGNKIGVELNRTLSSERVEYVTSLEEIIHAYELTNDDAISIQAMVCGQSVDIFCEKSTRATLTENLVIKLSLLRVVKQGESQFVISEYTTVESLNITGVEQYLENYKKSWFSKGQKLLKNKLKLHGNITRV